MVFFRRERRPEKDGALANVWILDGEASFDKSAPLWKWKGWCIPQEKFIIRGSNQIDVNCIFLKKNI